MFSMMKSLIITKIILLFILVSGCQSKFVYVDSKVPVLTIPQLQIIPLTMDDLDGCSDKAIDKLRDRDKEMKDHIKKLEITIEDYNLYAKERNSRVKDIP